MAVNDGVFLGRGDVRGPSSATDGAAVVFDGTSGKLIKEGVAGSVLSITGTANQITASAATGAVTLSVPTDFRVATSIVVGSATLAFSPIGALTVLDTSSAAMRGICDVQISSDTGSSRLNMFKARGVPATPTTIVTGDILGNVNAWGYDGTNYLNMASIRMVSTGTIGTGRVPTNIEFYTATDAATSVLTLGVTLRPTDMILPDSYALRVGSTAVAGIGSIRMRNGLANGAICWRNAANNDNALFGLDTNNLFQFAYDSGHGFTFDTAVDATMFVKTRGNADTAIVKANKVNATGNFQQNGTDGVTAGPFTTITSITVKGGIITAISGS